MKDFLVLFLLFLLRVFGLFLNLLTYVLDVDEDEEEEKKPLNVRLVEE